MPRVTINFTIDIQRLDKFVNMLSVESNTGKHIHDKASLYSVSTNLAPAMLTATAMTMATAAVTAEATAMATNE